MKITPKRLKWLLRLYGPYSGAGIKVESISEDWMRAKVSMKMKWYNKNALGTHFGGSLYSMVDPHYVLMLMNILGKKYVVWDKSSCIDFIKPGISKVSATFTLTHEIIETIKNKTVDGNKYLPEFNIDVTDESGAVVAKIHKTLYIRQKKK